jgi:NAD(P)-dependent dehydrogenase (short-subunit alcohol dehydrogenase family)
MNMAAWEEANGGSGTRRTLRMRILSWITNPGRFPGEKALRREVSGKTILITGASFGIGEATSYKLAAAGAKVLLVALPEAKLDEVGAAIRQAGGEAHIYPCDLTDMDAVAALASRLLNEHGTIDIIVNNAGRSIRRSISDSYDRFHDFTRCMDINYYGPVRLILSLLPSMRAAGRGHIVNISTIGVIVPPRPLWSAYVASKIAFDYWLKSIAEESRADGFTSTSIYMVLVFTRMSAPSSKVLRSVPGLFPHEAAGLIARAIVKKPKKIAPWWAFMAKPLAVPLRGWLGKI